MKIGERVGDHYTLVSMLGKGGMGEVWLADDERLGRKIAIKFFTMEFGDREKAGKRFLREARVQAQLRNPHVVTLYEFHFPDGEGIPYLAMEYVAGEALFDRLVKARRLEVGDALHVARQIAVALDEAHNHGVIHRDLKPENVLLSSLAGDPWYVKVVDFGLARSYEEEDETSDLRRLTTAAVILGTPAYMSPEQALGRAMDPRSDLYSLGVILYQLLSGTLPIAAKTPQEYLVAHQVQRPKLITEQEHCVALPPRLSALVMALLEKRPESRPATALIVARELQEIRRSLMSGNQAALSHTMAFGDGAEAPLPTDGPEPSAPESDREALGALQTQMSTQAFSSSASPLAGMRAVTKGFIGRDPELDLLMEHFRTTVRKAAPRAVALHGPAGVGISRLARSLLARVHKDNPQARLLRMNPWEGIADAPGRPLTDLLVRSAGLGANDNATTVRARFRDAFRKLSSAGVLGTQANADQLARRAGAVLGMLVGADPDSVSDRSPEAIYADVLEMGARFLSGVFGDTPTVLVIDNAENLRPTARAILGSWLERMRPAPWMVVLCVHGDQVPHLGPPDNDDRLRQVSIAIDPLTEPVMQAIARAHEQGLKRSEGLFREAAGRAGGLPGRLHLMMLGAMVGQAFDQYAKSSHMPEAETLRIAAACGGTFPAALVDAVAGIDCSEMLDLWCRQGVLTRLDVQELNGDKGYAFTSPRLFRLFEGAMDPRRRAAVHARALEWVREQSSGETHLLAARELSHHIGRQDLPSALAVAERLAVHALRIGGAAEAAQSSGRVLSALQSRAGRKALSPAEFGMYERCAEMLADIRDKVGRRDLAIDVLRGAERIVTRLEGPEFAASHARVVRALARRAGDEEERRELLERGVRLLGDITEDRNEHASLAAEITLDLAAAERDAARTTAAERALEQAERYAALSGSQPLALQAGIERARMAVSLGQTEQAEALYGQLRERSRSAGEVALEAGALLELGILLGRLGRADDAGATLKDAGALYEQIRDEGGRLDAELAQAAALLVRNDLHAARRTVEKVTIDPVNHPSQAARRLELLARILIATNEPERAQQAARQAIGVAAGCGDQVTLLRARLATYEAMAQRDGPSAEVSRGVVDLMKQQRAVGDVEGLARTYQFTGTEAAAGRLHGVRNTRAGEILNQALQLYRQVGCAAEAQRLETKRRRLGV